MKQVLIYILLLLTLVILAGCSKMDDNYRDYLTNRVYSPKVQNLTVKNGLKECTLTWTNPESNIAKSIEVRFNGDVLSFETMIDSLFIDNLEIKGYTMQVFTIDAFGNYSIPAEANVFPIGE